MDSQQEVVRQKKYKIWFPDILKIVDPLHLFSKTIIVSQQQVACVVVITLRTNTSSYSIEGVIEAI
jgi:hypothetical protein